MGTMTENIEQNKKWLSLLGVEKLTDFMLMHIRNLWSVDGLYFLGIEERFGTDAATEIDAKVWRVMAKIEARRIKEVLGLNVQDLKSFADALRATSWALDLENKEMLFLENNRLVLRNVSCRVQKTRLSKGLPEFPCKKVRLGFLEVFAKEMNPGIEVRCNICPPDPHPENLWCEWEFSDKIFASQKFYKNYSPT